MIQLHHDYLMFRTSSGETIPCSAEALTLEIVGENAELLDPTILRQAAAAVLHYFREDLGRDHVTIEEFTAVLERVLRGFGLTVEAATPVNTPETASIDLQQFVSDCERCLELAFFTRIREELKTALAGAPRLIAVNGLRGSVKHLLGVKRWCPRCQSLNDQIVDYLRVCLSADERAASCGLVIR